MALGLQTCFVCDWSGKVEVRKMWAAMAFYAFRERHKAIMMGDTRPPEGTQSFFAQSSRGRCLLRKGSRLRPRGSVTPPEIFLSPDDQPRSHFSAGKNWRFHIAMTAKDSSIKVKSEVTRAVLSYKKQVDGKLQVDSPSEAEKVSRRGAR